jgi:hypothetical protein
MDRPLLLKNYQKVNNPLKYIIDEEEVNVKDYKSGDYFGELALIKNDLRAANVIAKVKFNFIYFRLIVNC